MNCFRTLIAVLCLAIAPAVAGAETIKVGVAISLKEAMGEIAKAYEAETGDKVQFTFGASGQIATQIKSGADIDAFISAANKQIDELEKDKLLDATTRRVVTGNTLVLVVPAGAKDPPKSFEALADDAVKRVAVGEPKTVPAGQYAKQILDSLKITEKLKGKLVYGSNVRQVLLYVEHGEVSAGVVYATDARESGDKVKVVATADEKSHEPIAYPAAVVSASKRQDAGKKFLDYLKTEKSVKTLKEKGFKTEDAKSKPKSS